MKVTNCPVYIITSDTPVYWSRGSLIKKFNSRYNILYFNDDFCNDVKERYKIGFDRQKQLPYSTSMTANSNESKLYDISSADNYYNVSAFLFDEIIDNLYLKKDEKTYYDFCCLIDEIIKSKKKTDSIEKKWTEVRRKINFNLSVDILIKEIFLIECSYLRQNLLSGIMDMDLHIFTWIQNLRVSSNNLEHYEMYSSSYNL